MKKVIMVMGLVFLGLGLNQVVHAQARDSISSTGENIFAAFLNRTAPKAYQDGYTQGTSGQDEDANELAKLCSRYPENAVCREALPQVSECERECYKESGLDQFSCSYGCLRDKDFRTDDRVMSFR